MEKSLALRSRFELEGRAANTSKDSVIISAEDYARLEERLQNAEKLAIDMSQTGAKSFARSARTIAYLEGGNERMQTLLDHFRIVNIKLTSDVKLAREEALRAKGLEHRLKLSEESEKNTRNRLQQVENQLKLKEKEILENLQFAQDNNNRKNDNFDNEIRNLSDKLRSAQEQYLGLLKQYKVDKEVYEQSTRSLSDENQALNMQLSLLKSENMSLAQRVNECDMEITSLRMTLRERDDKLMISESSLSIVKQDHEINSESWNRKRRELEEDIADKIEFNRNLERQITMLKDSLRDAEMIHLKKDEIIGTFVAKQTEMVEENRQLRSKLDAVTADLFNFTHANSDLAAKLKEVEDELMESRNMYEDLKDIVHRDQALKLADAETQLRYSLDEVPSYL
jgi:chromosome segregation ATPase